MAQLARISRGVSAAFRTLPSMFLIEYQALKKTNPNPYIWMVAPRFFSNTNLSTTESPPTPRFSFFKWLFPTSKDKKGDNNHNQFKKHFKEKMMIVRVLLDYDEPHNHLVDGVKVLSTVLEVWKKFHPNFVLDYGVSDLKTPPILSLLSPYLKVDEKATREKISMVAERRILTHLLAYDDPKFADQVLIGVMYCWMRLVSEIECGCIDVWTTNKDKPDEELNYLFPSIVKVWMKGYKMMIYKFDDPDAMVEEMNKKLK